jgi:hypothetical protein
MCGHDIECSAFGIVVDIGITAQQTQPLKLHFPEWTALRHVRLFVGRQARRVLMTPQTSERFCTGFVRAQLENRRETLAKICRIRASPF